MFRTVPPSSVAPSRIDTATRCIKRQAVRSRAPRPVRWFGSRHALEHAYDWRYIDYGLKQLKVACHPESSTPN